MYDENNGLAKFGIIAGVVVVILLLVLGGFFAFVPAGYRGVALRFGAVTGDIRGEGVHLKTPFVSGNYNMEVRVQKEEVQASAASKDLQSVSSTVAVNYSLDTGKIATLYRDIGKDYKERVISPSIQESVKSVTARYTAEELITKRSIVSESIRQELITRLEKDGIIIHDLNIVDFDFSESFNKAIEAKVTAEQDALASKNKLEQVKYEAEQNVASAKGKAEAQRIEGEALRANPEVLQLRAIEKWQGNMPTYWGGGALPFLNIK